LLMVCFQLVHIVGTNGVTYIRWGRHYCGGKGAALIYKGIATPTYSDSAEALRDAIIHLFTAWRIYVQQMLTVTRRYSLKDPENDEKRFVFFN